MTSTLFSGVTPSALNASDGVAYTLGLRFTPAVDGTITEGLWYFPITLMSGVTMSVHRVSDVTTLGTKVFPNNTPAGRQTIAFDAPIAVTAGITYSISVWTPSHYTFTSAFTWPRTVGDLTAQAANGWFLVSPTPVMPTTQSPGAANYFPDVTFEPAVTAQSIAPTGISVPVAVGEPTLTMLTDYTIAPTGIAVPMAVGEPTLTFTEGPAPSGGSWDTLLGIVREAQADHERNAERIANPVDCPVHGWPLDDRHCLFGGHVV